jgi:transposase
MVPQTVVGLDLGKKSSHWTAVTASTGEIVRDEKYENDREHIHAWLKDLQGPVRVVFEACGAWEPIYDVLEGQVDEIQMAHPLQTRAIAHARIKTDKIDAGILAHLGRADLVPQAWIPPREVRELRELLRHRTFLVGMRTQVKNRIQSLLGKTGTETPVVGDLFGKKGLTFLDQLELRAPYGVELRQDLKVYEILSSEIHKASKRIEAVAKKDPRVGLLTPMVGIGTFSAMLIVAEIGDIDRFNSPEHLVSYAGLCPSTYQSGQTLRHGRITRRGSKWLRWVMVEAATHYGHTYSRHGTFYRRLMKRKGVKIARVALARELLRSVYWCLKKREEFVSEPERRVQGRSGRPLSAN